MHRVIILMVALALCAGLLTQTVAQAEGHAERKVINKIAPIYPDLAKRLHASGVVKLEVMIRPDGNVKSIRALGGNPVLILSATDAVSKWKFEAASEETTEVVQVAFEAR